MIDKYHEAKDQLKLQKVESKGYGVIYKLPMLDKDLDVVAKAFYAYICSYAGAGDTAFPGMDKICSDLGVSRQRLERHRKALVEKGYITINKIKDNKGRFDRNEYRINKELVPMLQNPTMDEPTMDEPTTDNVTTNNNTFNNNSFNNTNSNINTHTQQLADDFETFWSIYPKKVDKKKAFDKFKVKLKKHDFDTILKGAASYAKVMQLNNTDKQYIKGAAVFLNNENYLDDQSELLKTNVQANNKTQIFNPWEDDNAHRPSETVVFDNSEQLPTTVKQIGFSDIL